MTPSIREATQWLLAGSQGQPEALDQLMPLVYEELRRLAGRYLRRERPDHTLQATALVHEAYLRLIDQTQVDWRNHAHFVGLAARLMRQILVDHARAQHRQKRGGAALKFSLDELVDRSCERPVDWVDLDEALSRLASLDPRQSRIVELRFFGGLSIEETAEVLGVSISTVKAEWRLAKAWFRQQLGKEAAHDA